MTASFLFSRLSQVVILIFLMSLVSCSDERPETQQANHRTTQPMNDVGFSFSGVDPVEAPRPESNPSEAPQVISPEDQRVAPIPGDTPLVAPEAAREPVEAPRPELPNDQPTVEPAPENKEPDQVVPQPLGGPRRTLPPKKSSATKNAPGLGEGDHGGPKLNQLQPRPKKRFRDPNGEKEERNILPQGSDAQSQNTVPEEPTLATDGQSPTIESGPLAADPADEGQNLVYSCGDFSIPYQLGTTQTTLADMCNTYSSVLQTPPPQQ